MDWIKVKVSHVLYDFLGAPCDIFRAWLEAMALTATMEKLPTSEQLKNKLGKDNYLGLVKHFKKSGTSVEKVLKKVMEDVEAVYRKRKHSNEYMSEYRSKTLHKPLHGDNVNAKRRGDEIREDKRVISSLSELAKKDPKAKKALEKLGVKLK